MATPLGNENLAIMADTSNSSNMMALEELLEELLKGVNKTLCPHCYRLIKQGLLKGVNETLRPHCYQVTEQGVIMMKMFIINELRMYDLPKHSKSMTSFISGLLSFVDELINKKKSVDPIPIFLKVGC